MTKTLANQEWKELFNWIKGISKKKPSANIILSGKKLVVSPL